MTTSASSGPLVPSAPKRFIFNDDDLSKFLKSPAKSNLLRLVGAMGKSCASSSLYEYDPTEPLMGLSPAMAALHGFLTGMLSWLTDDIPPSPDRSKARFGDPAFRQWHQRLVSRSVCMVHTILQIQGQYNGKTTTIDTTTSTTTAGEAFDKNILMEAAQRGEQAASNEDLMSLDSVASLSLEDMETITELCAYLGDSFGHPVRLDYGTGHESSFQVFLFALCKLGCFGSSASSSKNPEEEEDEHPPPPSMDRLKAITLAIYHAYLKLTRQLQMDYMLEPAGSHGVWGLDDYHCLPFYFGACQLQAAKADDDPDIQSPSIIHQDRALSTYSDKYLYFGCIQYIKTLKTNVPFFESSPMLYDISNLPTWQKVATGLLRLYEGEVLNKRQVVQHLVFGKLFAANWIPSEGSPREPPTTSTFRELPNDVRPGYGGIVAPMVRAPWATNNSEQRPTVPSPLNSSSGDGTDPMMTMTKAPWAK